MSFFILLYSQLLTGFVITEVKHVLGSLKAWKSPCHINLGEVQDSYLKGLNMIYKRKKKKHIQAKFLKSLDRVKW
jgi:hypothetical protein